MPLVIVKVFLLQPSMEIQPKKRRTGQAKAPATAPGKATEY
jgi:hypothetical protein